MKLHQLYLLIIFITFSGCTKWEDQVYSEPYPVDVWIQEIQSESVIIRWTYFDYPYFDYYEVQRALNYEEFFRTGDEGPGLISKTIIGRYKDRDIVGVTAINLWPNTTYYFMIRVYSKHNAYADSKVITVTTLSN